MARLAGFEPATLGLEGRCSIQMSYRRFEVIRLQSNITATIEKNQSNLKSLTKFLLTPNHSNITFWSGQRDSNPRPPAPKAGALARLRYAPIPNEDRKNIQFSPSVNLHFISKVRHLQALTQPEVSDVSAPLPETTS